jgi:hypothetical protein
MEFTLQPQSINNHDLFTSYQEIYTDFKIDPKEITNQVLLLCPICLENPELKFRTGEELLFDNMIKDKNEFFVKYLANPNQEYDPPVTLLVPHYLSQSENKSM